MLRLLLLGIWMVASAIAITVGMLLFAQRATAAGESATYIGLVLTLAGAITAGLWLMAATEGWWKA